MKLARLYIDRNNVSTLEPLRGMPLIQLFLSHNQVSDLEPLIESVTLSSLAFAANKVESLEPLRHMTGLKAMNCSFNQFPNLEPLSELQLDRFYADHNEIESLEPLRDMPIRRLSLRANRITSLEPLKNMNLNVLWCERNEIDSLEPLRHMKELSKLTIGWNKIHDLEPIKDSNLIHLTCPVNNITSLSPLETVPLQVLDCSRNKLRELAQFIDLPPAQFFFAGNDLDESYLKKISQRWKDDTSFGHLAHQAEVEIAMRNKDLKRLYELRTPYQNSYYLTVPTMLNRPQAQQVAKQLGGKMVTINSPDENAFIHSLGIRSHNWLGDGSSLNGVNVTHDSLDRA